jgi:di/tricarboxylate transporter
MSQPIFITLSILVISLLLFMSERLRIDLVALMVLSALVLTGLVNADEALAGFSSPAVVTVWAVFILSAGLANTGVAGWLGQQVSRLGGTGEKRLLLVIMLASGFLSAFMNNMGVTAMMLPVVLDISRRTHRPPSKLLIPLAFSSLLGGMTTMIGTPANILAADALTKYGYKTFSLFDYTPTGLVIMVTGTLFMVFIGRWLLPSRDPSHELRHGLHEMGEAFAIEERLFTLSIPHRSALDGCPLAQSHLGSALNLNVIGVRRGEEVKLAPSPDFILQAGDKLFVSGRLDKLLSWRDGQQLIVLDEPRSLDHLITDEIKLALVEINNGSALSGRSLPQMAFRQKYGSTVLSVWHEGKPTDQHIDTYQFEPGDRLVVQATPAQLQEMRAGKDFILVQDHQEEFEHLQKQILLVEVPPDSSLCHVSIAESHLGDAYGLGLMGILRQDAIHLMPPPEEVFQPGDKLLIKGKRGNIDTLLALQGLEIEKEPALEASDMESQYTATVEAVLAPQSTLEGKTIRYSNFREKYNLSVLAIWRGGRPWRFNLRDMQMRFGDALLIFGRREDLRRLAQDPEFIVLTQHVRPPLRLQKAPLAAVIMLGLIITVASGLLPISLAAIIAATLMVLTGCLNMNEAYNAIDWRSVFLIAGMLPLGTAMQNSGTAQYLANLVGDWTQQYGVTAQLAGLFVLTSLASQIMPNPVVIVLMAPVALHMATNQGINPHSLIMLIAISASSSIITPIGHPSNVMVMGPGGYKFNDYVKVGLPLFFLVLAVTLLVLPVFWPL